MNLNSIKYYLDTLKWLLLILIIEVEVTVCYRSAVEKADILLSMNHGIAHLDSIWGVGGGNRPVKSLTNKVSQAHSLITIDVKNVDPKNKKRQQSTFLMKK